MANERPDTPEGWSPHAANPGARRALGPVWSSVAVSGQRAANGRMAIARLPPRLLRAASDERLVALTRAGAEAAFEAIYDRHHLHLLSFCRHMLGSHAEGEDAVQQT